MSLFTMEPIDIQESDLRTEKGIRAVMNYLYMLNEQLKYTLSNLSLEENMDADTVKTLQGVYEKINLTAKEIELRVKSGEVSAALSMEEGMIRLEGNRIVIESDNFTVSENGTIIANNATLTGTFMSQGVTDNRYILIGDGMLKTSFGDGNQYTEIQPGYISLINVNGGMVAQITPATILVNNGTISAGASGTLIGLLNSSYLLPIYNAGTYGPYIATAGSLQIATTNYAEAAATSIAGNLIASALSDFRLKQDMTSLDSLGTKEKWLEVLDEMKIKSFAYKPDTYELDDGKMHLGTVAQLLDNLLKEKGLDDYGLVRELNYSEKSRASEYTGGEKPLGVDYVGMVPLLVLGYQELRKEVADLRAELNEIKNGKGE